uniref:Cholesin n=1 Tax=Pan troglodytes TaxID=9598 RepID=A0A2I3RXI7_PANTR
PCSPVLSGPDIVQAKQSKQRVPASPRPILAAPPPSGAGEAVLRPGLDAEPERSPEEQRVLERKLKKERKKEERQRLREAGLVAQHPPARRSGAELALDYLCGWAQKHKNWRFQKTRQTWLLLHMYDSDKVPDEHFSTLLAYLEGLQGRARELTVQKAEALMRELDEEGSDPPLPGRAQRIRQVLQLLS